VRYSSRQALELVIERARRLAGSPLGKDAPEFTVRWTPPDSASAVGSDPLSFELALRIARQFLDPAESISFFAFAERVLDDPELSDLLRREFQNLVRELDASLDRPPSLHFKVRGQAPPPQREILDVFLYGSLQRLAPDRREPIRNWLNQPATALLVRSQLQTSLATLCKAIQQLRGACERELLRAAR
jgi:hypothetical protein